MRRPISLWTEGDTLIAELMREASQLHAAVLAKSQGADLWPIVERINLINVRLNPLEDAFSYSLGEASRKIRSVLLSLVWSIAAALVLFGSYISYAYLSRKEDFEKKLRWMTAQEAADQERRAADVRIRDQATLLDKARDAIIVRGMDHRILYWNKSAERLYGWTMEEAVGKSVRDLLYGDYSLFDGAIIQVLETGEWSGEIPKHRKDGSTVMVESRWTLMKDVFGMSHSIFAIDTDITERKAAENDILRLAFYDPLTGLPNRLLLQDRLRLALVSSDHRHSRGALLYVDLDNFKVINDTLGHEKGDLLLQQVAHRLISCVRESDVVARLGGDEFIVMLTDMQDSEEDVAVHAKSVADKILEALRGPFKLDGNEQYSGASIGITLFQDRHDTVGELLKRADLAMYQAKAMGRNNIRFFNQEMQAAVSARATLESDLRQALRENQFQLYYQPQMNHKGRMVGMEALVRWQHPVHGMVSPANFIATTEETALILPLGQWVLQSACEQLEAWAAQPSMALLSIAVNVSARQFHHEHFLDQTLAIIDKSGVNPARLKLELTESVLLDDLETTIAKMAALKEKGVGFSLDDFGTGYSSLSYLKRLPLDQLKIDRSFVRDVLTDSNDAVIACAIVSLAQSLGLEVIAEGVETKGQRDFLDHHDCHLYQGYFFSPPLSADQVETFIREAEVGYA
jgi:diguanylate cyclase (GGDEF)-like protein/PAS domain S-box-containing protein